MTEKSQHSNIMLAFFTLAAVIVIVSIIGFFTLGKGPEIIQGQAEATVLNECHGLLFHLKPVQLVLLPVPEII